MIQIRLNFVMTYQYDLDAAILEMLDAQERFLSEIKPYESSLFLQND